MPATGLLSDECVSLILQSWLGDDRSAATARRSEMCDSAIASVYNCVQTQLSSCGFAHPAEWRTQRAVVIGYVNAVSNSLVKKNGETSRWATAFVALNVLSLVLKTEWHEATACKEAEALWEIRDPGYLAGIAAARLDVSRIGVGDSNGLTRLLLDGKVDLAGPVFTRPRPAPVGALAAQTPSPPGDGSHSLAD